MSLFALEQIFNRVFDSTSNRLKVDNQASAFSYGADAVTATYPNNVTEIYAFRVGGASGTIVKTVTVVYTNSSKQLLLSVEQT